MAFNCKIFNPAFDICESQQMFSLHVSCQLTLTAEHSFRQSGGRNLLGLCNGQGYLIGTHLPTTYSLSCRLAAQRTNVIMRQLNACTLKCTCRYIDGGEFETR